MIQIDSHETEEYDRILKQVLPIERKLLNQLPGKTDIKPDFVLLNGGKVVTINHKQMGEAIGNLTKLEEQLSREIDGLEDTDCIALMIDGVVTEEPNGTCQTWYRGKNVWLPGRQYQVRYSSVVGFFTRLWRMGIPVIRTNGVLESCSEMIAIHKDMEKEEWEHKTFNQLYKSQIFLTKKNRLKPQEIKKLAEVLMNIPGSGMAEEAAMSIAEWFHATNKGLSLLSVLRYCESGNFLSEIPMRGSNRRIGPSIEKKFREAVGL